MVSSLTNMLDRYRIVIRESHYQPGLIKYTFKLRCHFGKLIKRGNVIYLNKYRHTYKFTFKHWSERLLFVCYKALINMDEHESSMLIAYIGALLKFKFSKKLTSSS